MIPGSHLTSVSPLDLERISGGAWRAAEEGALGDWRLNAALGQSGRINRRPGLARRLLAALLAAAREAGARRAWLQVEAANPAASRLYEGMGFEPAYRYHYWRRP